MRTFNNKEDLERLIGYKSIGTRFRNVYNKIKTEFLKKPLIYIGVPITTLFTIFSFATSCKAEPITQEEIVETKPPVTETVEKTPTETIVETKEEVKVDPLQEKISQYDLEGLMTEIQQKDPELYEHYTAGDVDTFLPVLANISKYISNEKILERRPTTESLTGLNNIIMEFSNENDKKPYVVRSFEKELVVIVNASSDSSPVSTIILMNLCEKLNKDYLILDNTSEDVEYFEWFKKNTNMWHDLKETYNILKIAKNTDKTNKNIKTDINANELLEYNRSLSSYKDYRRIIYYFLAHRLDGTIQVSTTKGDYGGYNESKFFNSFPKNIDILIKDFTCDPEYVYQNRLSNNLSVITITKKGIGDSDGALIEYFAYFNSDKRITAEEYKKIANAQIGELIKGPSTDFSYVSLNGMNFYFSNGGKNDIEVNFVNVPNNLLFNLLSYELNSSDSNK